MYYSPSLLPQHLRRKPVEDPEDLKKPSKEPVIDDLSDSEIGEASGGEKEPAVEPASVCTRKRTRRATAKRPAKKTKATRSGPGSISKSLAEDADRESNHAYDGVVDVVKMPV